MTKHITQREVPKGIGLWLLRFPVWVYRLGLGGLMTNHFLLLNHIGRKSGEVHQTVIEVVRHDKETGEWIVAVGFGPRTQWYQNLLVNPDVKIQVGWRKYQVRAEELSREEGGEQFVQFTRRSKAGKVYARSLGFQVDGSEEDYREMGRMIIFMAFRPR